MARTKKQEPIDNKVQDIQVTGEEEAVVEIAKEEAVETTETVEKEEVKPIVKEEPAKKEISKSKEEAAYNPWWRF